jgi:hypothetical protein
MNAMTYNSEVSTNRHKSLIQIKINLACKHVSTMGPETDVSRHSVQTYISRHLRGLGYVVYMDVGS